MVMLSTSRETTPLFNYSKHNNDRSKVQEISIAALDATKKILSFDYDTKLCRPIGRNGDEIEIGAAAVRSREKRTRKSKRTLNTTNTKTKRREKKRVD